MRAPLTAAFACTLALAAACAPDSTGTRPRAAVQFPVVTWLNTVGEPDLELFEVCKRYVGGGSQPATTITIDVAGGDGSSTSFSFSLAANSCRDVWLQNLSAADHVTATETVPPAYAASWAVKQADQRSAAFGGDGALHITSTSGTGAGPAGGPVAGSGNLLGQTVTFTNTYAPGSGGCTLGFWKNHTARWPAGYATGSLVKSVSGSTGSWSPATDPVYAYGGSTLGDQTLLTALAFQGGSTVSGAGEILLRQAVAALLNTAYGVPYPLSKDQVIVRVRAALLTQDRDALTALADELDGYNNGDCTADD